MKKLFLTLPNALSFLRLILGFTLFFLAWSGKDSLFIGTLICAFFLDLIDGPIARWTHQTSKFGSWIDSLADFTVYIGFIIGAWWLWPDIFVRELIFVCLLTLSIVVPVLVGYIKFRQATSYHTWLVKFAVVCMAPSSLVLFIYDIAWPFRIASIISVMAGIEEVVISLVLDKPRSDIRSLFHVIRCTRKRKLGGLESNDD